MTKRNEARAAKESANEAGEMGQQKNKVSTQDEFTPLTKTEKVEFKKYEKEVDQHKEGVFKMAAALIAIKNKKLYREEAATFEAYCDKRFDFKRAYAYKLIQAGEVQNELVEMGAPQVSNESQARLLRSIENKEDRGEVMHKAQALAGEGKEILGEHLTAAIEEIQPEMRGKRTATTKKRSSNKIDSSSVEKWLETIVALHKRLVDYYDDSEKEIATLVELKKQIETALGKSEAENIIGTEAKDSEKEDSKREQNEGEAETDNSENDLEEEGTSLSEAA